MYFFFVQDLTINRGSLSNPVFYQTSHLKGTIPENLNKENEIDITGFNREKIKNNITRMRKNIQSPRRCMHPRRLSCNNRIVIIKELYYNITILVITPVSLLAFHFRLSPSG